MNSFSLNYGVTSSSNIMVKITRAQYHGRDHSALCIRKLFFFFLHKKTQERRVATPIHPNNTKGNKHQRAHQWKLGELKPKTKVVLAQNLTTRPPILLIHQKTLQSWLHVSNKYTIPAFALSFLVDGAFISSRCTLSSQRYNLSIKQYAIKKILRKICAQSTQVNK